MKFTGTKNRNMIQLAMISLLAFSTLLSACSKSNEGNNPSISTPSGNGSENQTETAPASDPEASGKLKGKIVLSNRMPEQTALLEKAIEEYKKVQPDVTVDYQIKPWDGYETFLKTTLIGGSAPDVMFTEEANTYRSQDLILSLDDYLNAPNPYSDTGKPWKDDFVAPYVDMTRDGAGRSNMVPWTIFSLGLFYNQEMYEKAGVTELPATWNEWKQVNQQLADADLLPWGVAIKPDDAQSLWAIGNWMNAAFRSDYEALNLKHKEGWTYDPNDPASTIGEAITIDELWIGYKKGILDPAKSEKFRSLFQLFKEMTPYMNKDFMAIGGSEVPQRFLTAKNAQFYNGTWFVGNINQHMESLKADGKEEQTFRWGVIPFPKVGPENGAFFDKGESNELSGLRNGFMVKKSDDANATNIAIDFLRFLTSPKMASELFPLKNPDNGKRYVADIAAIAGVPPMEGAEKLTPVRKYADLNLTFFADQKDQDEFWGQWQKYLTEKITLDEFTIQRSKSFEAGIQRQLKLLQSDVDQALIDSELK